MKLETPRLILRPLTPEDVNELTPINQDPQVMRYICTGTYGYEATLQRLVRWHQDHKNNGYGPFAIIERITGNFLGFSGLINQTIDGEPSVEIGYRLDRHYWGQGLATEAASAIRDFAFNERKLPRLTSIIHKNNLASIRVAEKLGMTYWKDTMFDGIPCVIYEINRHH